MSISCAQPNARGSLSHIYYIILQEFLLGLTLEKFHGKKSSTCSWGPWFFGDSFHFQRCAQRFYSAGGHGFTATVASLTTVLQRYVQMENMGAFRCGWTPQSFSEKVATVVVVCPHWATGNPHHLPQITFLVLYPINHRSISHSPIVYPIIYIYIWPKSR